jgi:hypothetical protein
MKTELKRTALAAAIALVTGAAYGGPLSWTELGVGYQRMDDSGDSETDAYDIRGSIGLGQMFHIQADYLDGSSDPDVDFDGYEVRAGVHPSVGENTQAVVEVIYFDYTVDLNPGNDDEDGYGLGFGVRHKVGDQFEVRGQVDYYDGSADISGDFNNTAFSASGRYYWTPAFFTGAGVTVGGVAGLDSDTIRIDAGWSFGGDVM